MPACFGALRLDSPVWMAPMVGYNEAVTRRLCRRFGAATSITEMLKPEQLLKNPRSLRTVLQTLPDEGIRGAQIACADVAEAEAAAAWVGEAGFDYIELNFGCPLPKERRRRRGAALLADPEQIEALVAAVVHMLPCPVAVKVRSGPGEGRETIAEVARAVQQGGAAALCVHGRAADQPYDSPSRLAPIARAREAAPGLLLLGNGDIEEPSDAQRMVAETGCDGVVIGRGMVGNPWLLARVRAVLGGAPDPGAPTPQQIFDQLLDHAGELVELLGPRKGLGYARRYGHFYFAGFPEITLYRARVARLGPTLADFAAGLRPLVDSLRRREVHVRLRAFEAAWRGPTLPAHDRRV